jgi:hypothetical protein
MEKDEVPFFVRFLENQEVLQVRTDVKAGRDDPPMVTLKFPSDSDEGDI